jgi:hypothetical protein
MSKQNTFEDDVLAIIFTAVALANFWDNAAASPVTNLYISLHTGDPGEAGDQTTSECAYTGYSRVAVARSAAGWTVASGTCDNDAAITFGTATGGTPETATYFGVGKLATTAGKLLYSGAITSPGGGLVINNGVQPQFAAGALDVTED